MIRATIDLNCDIGEYPDQPGMARDLALLEIVTSANIACGGHAGTDASMRAVVRAAVSRSVAIGAHPSFPDPANFGRARMRLPSKDLESLVSTQVGALDRHVRAAGARLTHVKPHGALYHTVMTDPDAAGALAAAVRPFGERIRLVGMAGAPAIGLWRAMGMRVASEAFVDRRYDSAATLRDRSASDSLITDPGTAVEQALLLAAGGELRSSAGRFTLAHVDTLCVHSDTPGALSIATATRDALIAAGWTLSPIDQS